ncbi:MAG: hypothetical protein V2I26_16400 [Halieaceae bacterium]|jgi:hypothetical protein|nr:hypothetical protein [Halieaceae bacterium]
MSGRFFGAAGLTLLLAVGGANAADKPRGAVQCADLKWSAEVLAANPDIASACQGVYEKDGVLYARATIEVVRVLGNTLRFRTLLKDGSLGKRRSVSLDSQWRVSLDGREYRLSELSEGQRLNIYLPEDRFALTVLGSNAPQASAIEAVEE